MAINRRAAPAVNEPLEARRLMSGGAGGASFVGAGTLWLNPPGGSVTIIDTTPGEPGVPVEVPMPLLYTDVSRGWPGNVTAASDAPHRLAVRFQTAGTLDESSVVGRDDLFSVATPAGARIGLRYVDSARVGSDLVTVYEVDAPGGAWDYSDNGTYVVMMRADQALLLGGRPAPNTFGGAFQVNVPHPLARFRGEGDVTFVGTGRGKGRRPAPAMGVAFDNPVGDAFEAAVMHGPGSVMTGAARMVRNRIVIVGVGTDEHGRARAYKMTGRVNAQGAIRGRWVEVVEGRRAKHSGTFSLTVGTPHWMFQ